MLFQRAFAKINLGLRILRKRDDGYHDLETVFHRIDLADELAVAPSEGLSLSCSEPALDTPDNLVLAAGRALRERYGVREGARISLLKRIPHGAGLGGGSSDAAAALQLLTRLWDLRPDPGELAGIALTLGSDVPFFLGDRSAHALSRGERLDWFHLALPQWILVVCPPIHVSTREAFGRIAPRTRGDAPGLKQLVERGTADPSLLRGAVENDFEPSVFRAHPEIGAIRDRLYESGATFAQMSGSGSSVYGLFAAEESVRRALEGFGRDYRVFLTRPGFVPDLSRRERPGGAID